MFSYHSGYGFAVSTLSIEPRGRVLAMKAYFGRLIQGTLARLNLQMDYRKES